MNWIRFGFLPALLYLVAGCADLSRVASLEKKTEDLQAEVKTLKASVETLEQQQSTDRLFRDLGSIAYLTPGEEGYSVIETDLGRMTVQLANVEEYASGTRVTLRFGNLTSATINGAKAKLEWGRVDDKGLADNDHARSRDVSFTESLQAGAWTNVRVVLDGVPPKEFGFVRVRDMTHSGIRLSR